MLVSRSSTTKRQMRIGFNLWQFRDGARWGGFAYYGLSLLREFANLIPENMTIFHGSHGRDLLKNIKGYDKIKIVELKYIIDVFKYRSDFDVLFTPFYWPGIDMLDWPTVNVIPDIQEQYYPQFHSADELHLRRVHHPHGARTSTLLITISNFSKKTIVEKFGVAGDNVRVTYLGAHPIFSDEENPGVRPGKLPHGVDKFLFYPANSWRHKNHKAILDALVVLRAKYQVRIPCIFTGYLFESEFNNVDLPAEILARGLNGQVFHIGSVSLPELKYLYLNAAALVHPSLFEGFGIPLVEAMSCGCPIIASERTSIPEIAREAALYFNPDDARDLAGKIWLFMNEHEEVQGRVSVGRSLSREFSDKLCAEKTLQVLNEAYEIASLPSMKAKVKLLPLSDQPFLTAVFDGLSFRKKLMISSIENLCEEFGHRVQIILIVPAKFKNLAAKTFSGEIEIVTLQGKLQEAIDDISRRAKGKYLFFCDGNSNLMSSFLYYLMAYDGLPGTSSELLDGNCYLMDRKGNFRGSLDPLENEAEDRRSFFRQELPAVVLRDAFVRVMANRNHDIRSLADIADELWMSCRRKRIYRVVKYRMGGKAGLRDINLLLMTQKIRSHVQGHSKIGWFLRTTTGNLLLQGAYLVYSCLPAYIQRKIYEWYFK